MGQQRGSAVRPYVWMLTGSAFFAIMGTLAHALGPSCSWQEIAIARSGIVLLISVGLARRGGVPLVLWRPPVLWVRSLAGSTSVVCTFYALTRLPVADVLTLTNMFPVWVALLSWPLLGEPPRPGTWLAVVSGVTGIVLIQQPHLAEGNFAMGVALLSSLTSAIAMLGLNQIKGVGPSAIVVHFSAVSLLVCLAAWVLLPASANGQLAMPWQIPLLLGVGVTAAIGQLCLTHAFSSGPAAKVSVVGLSQIVFAMPFDVLLWGQPVHPATLLGIFLVVAPTAWLLTRPRKEKALPMGIEPMASEREATVGGV